MKHARGQRWVMSLTLPPLPLARVRARFALRWAWGWCYLWLPQPRRISESEGLSRRIFPIETCLP